MNRLADFLETLRGPHMWVALLDADHPIGYLAISVGEFADAVRKRKELRGDPPPTDEHIVVRLEELAQAGTLSRNGATIVEQVLWFRGSPERLTQNSDATALDVRELATARDTMTRGFSGLNFVNLCAVPVTDVLPTRPHLRLLDPIRPDPSKGLGEPTFGEYFALAVTSGDKPAIDAITKWMRQNVRRQREPWVEILEVYEATRTELIPLAAHRRTSRNVAAHWLHVQDTAVGKRLNAHGLDNRWRRGAPPREIAAALTAAEYHVSPQTLLKEHKKSASGTARKRKVPKSTR